MKMLGVHVWTASSGGAYAICGIMLGRPPFPHKTEPEEERYTILKQLKRTPIITSVLVTKMIQVPSLMFCARS